MPEDYETSTSQNKTDSAVNREEITSKQTPDADMFVDWPLPDPTGFRHFLNQLATSARQADDKS